MKLRCPAFEDGARIPERHTADGADVSPHLTWSDLPEGTEELALVVDDPDAPRPEPWVHWVVYGIDPTCDELPEGIRRTPRPEVPVEVVQGTNSFGDDAVGYRGPAPPPGHGLHHYRFILYALSEPLGLSPGATKADLLEAMEGRVLGTAVLTGLYER